MNIGDKFVHQLLGTEKLDEDTFRGDRIFVPNPRTIYGGELMAQALMAASKTVPEGFKPNSLHCYFHDRASVKESNQYQVIRLRDGHSFCHRMVEAVQITDETSKIAKANPFFRMDCSFKMPESDPASFISTYPTLPPLSQAVLVDEYIKTLDVKTLPSIPRNRLAQFQAFDKSSPIEMRFCEIETVLGLKSNPSGRLHAWMRLKESPTTSLVPYRDALLTYMSDVLLIWVGLTEPHPVSYLVTLNQSIWFHNPDICPEPDEWIAFQTRAHYVGGALNLSYGAMWDSKGRILASMAQQGLMRTQQIPPNTSYTSLEQQAMKNSK